MGMIEDTAYEVYSRFSIWNRLRPARKQLRRDLKEISKHVCMDTRQGQRFYERLRTKAYERYDRQKAEVEAKWY